jgi:hypothetical protein
MIELSTIEETALIDDVQVDPPGGWGVQSLLIRQIRRDGGTQARIGLNEDTVQEYAELMREHRWDFRSLQRPIVLYDGSAFWLADGFHRIEAAQRAQLSDFPVDVIRGSKRDAILRAAGANSQHGLRRTRDDVQRAIALLLKDAEWQQWSNVKIAAQIGCSDKTVADVRCRLESASEIPSLTTRQGADGKSYPVPPVAPKPSAINRPDGSPSNGAQPVVCGQCGGAWGAQGSLIAGAAGFICEKCAKVNQQAIIPPAAPDLSSFGFSTRVLPDGRIAIRSEGNLESQHTHAQINDLIAYWRGYPAVPADLASAGVTWRYRQDKMYQVLCGDKIGHTGYTAAECLDSQRESMQRTGLLPADRLPLGTPIELPIPTGDDAADDAAMVASIRELAEPLGLQMIWEDGKVQLYWPHEIDDIDQMDLLSYGAALEWLKWEAKGIKQDMEERAADGPAPALAPIPPTSIDQLDAILPPALLKAGYYWHSATPPTLAQNGSAWRGEAPTPDQALQLAYTRERSKGEPLTVFPALNEQECKALIREAKVFIESGADRKLPTIGKLLRIAARMALEVTED